MRTLTTTEPKLRSVALLLVFTLLTIPWGVQGQVDPGFHPNDTLEDLLDGIDFEASIAAPRHGMEGTLVAVALRAANGGDLPIQLEVTPSIPDTDACTLTGFHVQSGTEVSETSFVLTPRGDRSLERAVARYDLGDDFEPSAAIPSDSIHITLALKLADHDISAGCEVRALFVASDGLGSRARSLSDTIQIVPVTTPVFLGYISGHGGPVDNDHMRYNAAHGGLEIPSEVSTAFTTTDEAEVLWQGLGSFDDGPDVNDYGDFRIVNPEDGTTVPHSVMQIAEPEPAPTSITATERLEVRDAAHVRCFVGKYIDGGVTRGVDGSVEKCVEIRAVKIETMAPLSMTVAELDHGIRTVIGGGLPQTTLLHTVQELLSDHGRVHVPTPNGGVVYVDLEAYESLVGSAP